MTKDTNVDHLGFWLFENVNFYLFLVNIIFFPV